MMERHKPAPLNSSIAENLPAPCLITRRPISDIGRDGRNHSPARHAQVSFSFDDQVSLAIGKGGHNIKLAGRLTGYEIDVYREDDHDNEDVSLDEFADEIDKWILDELKAIGCDTARSVLELGPKDLVKRTDLEEETIEEVHAILKAEFE